MQSLASFVMRGRSQAVMSATVLAILSLLFPPVSILSCAVVALVTLRSGIAAGAIVLLLTGVASGVLAQVVLGNAIPVIGFFLVMWLPGWLLAMLLRVSRSLALTLQGGVVLALVMLASQYLQVQDPVAQWRDLLEPFTQSLVESQLVENSQQPVLLQEMAQWMPGLVTVGFLLQSMASMLLARWWQARLYNPGGFRQEYHQLRLPRSVAIVTALILGLMLLNSGQITWLEYVAMLLLSAWFFHGLALAHGVLGLIGANRGWLIGIYALLLFALPHAVTALAAAGFVDAWFDFRARLRSGKGPGETG